MLNQDTKRKIDSARQILVGKVPDPKAQVEQITTALIYKFMDDMDKEAQELGGKARFFTNGHEKYAWTKLIDAKLGGHDRLDLYIEAITSLSHNPHIPQLFRDIFKDTFLPYRNPETLSLFLKEVNDFNYEHSEDLGDAFEYLLSILGSQGDAGQFRTPRHIIDFIVATVDPKKDETVCDPACGTAGFLISTYKHILKQHDGLDDPENKEKPLTPDERKNLMNNFVGYDISPDMVRLSKVNLYLHGFPSPTIFEYDTLSSEEKWDESFDVILANPPFMSPKGGIRPHKRFSIQANRSEVLFVDYIMEHLTIKGRAGIIVPEGIIFKGDKAYKALRKKLVEDGLFAVVSLPAGVFQPYSGVKTSILLFDNEIAKMTDEMLFVKIENDGFDLGAQRREIDKNDLPLAVEILEAWKQGKKKKNDIVLWVKKEKIAETGDYNLTGERYKEVEVYKNVKWDFVKIGDIFDSGRGRVINKNYIKANKGEYPVYSSQTTNNGIFGNIKTYDFNGEYLTWTTDGANAGKVFYRNGKFNCTNVCGTLKLKDKFIGKIDLEYIAPVLDAITENFVIKVGNPKLMNKEVERIKIPLPPIEVQKEIVEQIEVKQNAINHAKEIIKNLERERQYFGQELRKLEDVEWVELGEVCEFINGRAFKPKDWEKKEKGGLPIIRIQNLNNPNAQFNYFSKKVINKLIVERGDLLFSWSGSRGTSFGPHIWNKDNGILNQHIFKVKFSDRKFEKKFLYYALKMSVDEVENNLHGGVGLVHITKGNLEKIKIPLPPLAIQRQLVAEAEKEEKIITANKNLIEIMEKKIKKVVEEV